MAIVVPLLQVVSAAAETVSGPDLTRSVTAKVSVGIAASSTIWSPNAEPRLRDSGDDKAVELGVKFRTGIDGRISAVRYFRSDANGGSHTVSLWSRSGMLLGQAESSEDGSTGWQQVPLASPVAVRAGETYIASYHTDSGHYSADVGFFSGRSAGGPILSALAADTDGPNGVYAYGPSQFPSRSWESTNYWVDVVFEPLGTGTTPVIPTTTVVPTGTTTAVVPTGVRSCRPYPAMPDASCTGVPAGTLLRPSGSIRVTVPGTVLDSLDVSGCIVVRASNVTIRRTRVRGGFCDNQHQIDVDYGSYTNVLIEDVEVDGLRTTGFGAGIGNSGFTCRRCNIHGVGQGISITNDVLVEDSYIYDLISEGDPATSGSHNEAIISNGGYNMIVRHNNLDGETKNASSALSLYGDFGQIDRVLVENNLFNGGGYCVYGGSVPGKPYPLATNTRFVNNLFGQRYFAGCGYYGAATSFDIRGAGNAWSGNVWDVSGAVVPPGL